MSKNKTKCSKTAIKRLVLDWIYISKWFYSNFLCDRPYFRIHIWCRTPKKTKYIIQKVEEKSSNFIRLTYNLLNITKWSKCDFSVSFFFLYWISQESRGFRAQLFHCDILSIDTSKFYHCQRIFIYFSLFFWNKVLLPH